MNWQDAADQLIEKDPPAAYRLLNSVPSEVIDQLIEKMPDFRRGDLCDWLEIDEFESSGPVHLFRSGCLGAATRFYDWAEIRGQRAGLGA
ncbi:MAG: hypothetical protein ABSG98_05820 [Anaerolineales bacterium]|jgi:hypothetical protein